MINQFHKLNKNVIFPFIYYGYILSYFANGHQFIQCLQSTTYSSSIQFSQNQSILVLMVATILTNIFCFIGVEKFQKSSIFNIISLEIFYFYESVTWILLYYHQIVNLNALRQIRDRYLESSSSSSGHKRTISNYLIKCKNLFINVKQLADLNTRIQSILSYLLCLHILDSSSFLILSTTDLAAFNLESSYKCLIELPIRISLWIGLCMANKIVIMEFDRIENSIQKSLRSITTGLKRKKIFKYKEMEIFRESFQLIMFDFFIIDFALFMDWIIFIAGYVTIIYQTNN